jgi:hypothetical protein
MSSFAGSGRAWLFILVLFGAAAAGCGGGSNTKDATTDASDVGVDLGGDVNRPDLGTDTGGSDSGDAGTDTPTDVPKDVAGDVAIDVPTDVPTDVAGDVANDIVADRAPDGTDGPMDAPSEEVPAPPVTLTVDALQHTIVLDRCTGFTPATLVDVAAGAHTIALTASTLSKGSVSAGNDQLTSYDDYVIVNVPLPAADQSSRRFFMLNGINGLANFTLPALGTLRVMFIDGDAQFNAGQGTVRLDGTGASATVDATANVLPWNAGCLAIAQSINVSDRPHRATLTESTLSTGGGSKDDLVLLRLPSERPMDPMRFVILNGVGATVDFTPYMATSLRGWFIAASAGATGRATVTITDL